MNARTKDFTAKARGIVGVGKPRSLGDFLEGDQQPVSTESRAEDTVRKAGDTESRAEDTVRKAGDTESRAEDTVRKAGDIDDAVDRKTAREEFRFDADLAERLRRCAFETRCKKTTIVREALDRYLKDQGF